LLGAARPYWSDQNPQATVTSGTEGSVLRGEKNELDDFSKRPPDRCRRESWSANRRI